MSLISKLLGKLFGSNQQIPEKINKKQEKVNDYVARWEKERNERIEAAELRLKDWIVASLRKKGGLTFTWESGSDEAFVTFNDNNEAESDNFEDLECYVIDKLDIPDAGEFLMNGNGTIYLSDNLVKAKYSSVIKIIIDFDEETEQEIFGEEEQESDDKVLFAV